MVLLNISNIPKHRLVLGKIKHNNQTNYINAIILNSTILTRKSSDDVSDGVQTNILNKTIDSNKSKNTIVLSCILLTDTTSIPNLTLTQQNIHNNLVHIFRNNNINDSRIIFRNYSQINNIHNNNQYLVDDEDINASNTISDYDVLTGTTQYSFADNQFYINYYDRYNSTDYYNIDISSILLDNTVNNITLNDISINDTYAQDNSNILIDINRLKSLYTISNENLDNNNIYITGSTITKNKLDKLLLFTKPDISTSINLTLNRNKDLNNSNIIINTVLLKNYNRYNNKDDHSSKILFHRDNSINIINCTSFGISTTSIKASNFIINNPNIVFLSLGNFNTGLTIQNIKNNISGKDGKFYFINNITEDLNYLIDTDYNTNYANLYQNLNIGDIEKNNKQKTVSIDNIFDICFNNSLLKNIEFENNVLYKDISNQISYNVDIANNANNGNNIYSINNTEIPSSINLAQNLLGNNILDHSIFFNFRLNYNIGFTSTQYYGIKYNSTNYSILPISIISDFYVISGGEFQNIGCIFTYYNPEREETPDIYKYPYNNIDICSNPIIDNFEKAIEVLPGQRTQFSNSVFIPNKNGSNLSRKHIQGLVGLNNIPKLLSIKPYDPDFIIGRDSTNLDDCITQNEQIKRKINAMKYKNNDFNNNNSNSNSNSNSNTSNNQRKQFARLINNRAVNRSRLSCPIDYDNLGNNIYTPFKIYKSR